MGRHSRSISRSRSRDRRGTDAYSDGYDQDQDGYRVHIADLGVDCSQKELERTFTKYGEYRELWLARNPPCFAFCVYKHRADAEEAIKEMDGRIVCNSRVRVSWARPRTRGRNARFDPNMRCYQCGQRGHFSRDCNNRNGRSRGYDDDNDHRRSRRRRSRSRSRSRGGGRYRRRSTHSRSRSRSRSPKRHNGDAKEVSSKRERSRSRSRSRDRRRHTHRSRSNDRHRSRSRSRSRRRSNRSRSRSTRRRSISPKAVVTEEAAVVVPNGVEETKKLSRSRSVSKHSEDSHNGSRHRGGRGHEHPSEDEEESDTEAAKQTNGDAEERYDPTKTDDEAELSPSHNELSNGDNIVNGDYQSNNEEE